MSSKELPITASGLTRSEFIKRYGFDPLKEIRPNAPRYNWKMKQVQKFKAGQLKIKKA